MNEREDIDGLAAEYVLGTLDASERTAVSARRRREGDLDAAIGAWERRLSPLADAIPEVSPPAGLLPRIEARLASATGGQATGSGQVPGQVIELERRMRRWRAVATAASALAASALFLGETIGPWRLAGAGLVIAAIVLGALAKGKSPKGSDPLSKR